MSEYGTSTQRERDLKHMESPYREGTKLDRIFLFMQDGNWYPLWEIRNAAYTLDRLAPLGVRASQVKRRRTASALRTIRSHPDLYVRCDGVRYCLELVEKTSMGVPIKIPVRRVN